MSDKEIIRALECCYGFHCERCPLKADIHCRQKLLDESIDFINRQQAEIELLEIDNERMTTKVFEMAMKKVLTEKVRAEAIKEFATRLAKRFDSNSELNLEAYHSIMGNMEELYFSMTGEEMVGTDNG